MDAPPAGPAGTDGFSGADPALQDETDGNGAADPVIAISGPFLRCDAVAAGLPDEILLG
jgi:hypothetical protein